MAEDCANSDKVQGLHKTCCLALPLLYAQMTSDAELRPFCWDDDGPGLLCKVRPIPCAAHSQSEKLWYPLSCPCCNPADAEIFVQETTRDVQSFDTSFSGCEWAYTLLKVQGQMSIACSSIDFSPGLHTVSTVNETTENGAVACCPISCHQAEEAALPTS